MPNEAAALRTALLLAMATTFMYGPASAQDSPDIPPEPPRQTEPPLIRGPGVAEERTAPEEEEAPAATTSDRSVKQVSPTPSGETGLLRIAAAEGARARTIRLAFGLDFFDTGSVFVEGDDLSRVGGTLSISGSPVEHLELWLNTRAQSTGSSLTNPSLLQAQGDLGFGVKGYYGVSDAVTVGLDLELTFLSGVGEASFNLDATQFRTRALLTADLRETEAKAPVRLHLNFGAIVDGSDKLSTATMSDPERFALGISDFHRLVAGFAIEVPVKYVTPYLEYGFEIPLGYLATPGIVLQSSDATQFALRAAQLNTSNAIDPARPSIQRALPQRLTPGVRVTAIPDLTLDLAVEIGLTPDTATGVVPVPPYNVILLASYTLDPFAERGGPSGPSGPPVTVPVLVPEVKEVTVASQKGYVMGRVADKKDGRAIKDAIVSSDRSAPVATAKDGRFLSHEVEPGPLTLTIERDGYKPATVETTIAAGETVEANVTLESAVKKGVVQGTVKSEDGRALANVEIRIAGADTQKLATDGKGAFSAELKEGGYSVVARDGDHLLKGATVQVADNKTIAVDLVLRKRPAEPMTKLADGQIELVEPIEFGEGDAELSASAKRALDALVDLLLSREDMKKVRIESHLDSSVEEGEADRLTQKRADNVVAYLVANGVAQSRLTAEGAGSKRPKAPNLTLRGRKLNRRVEIHLE